MTSSAQLALDGTHPMYETEQGIENRRWQGCARGLTDDKRQWNQWQLVTESPMAAALSSRIGESFCWGGAKEVGEAAEDAAQARREPAVQPRRGGAGSRRGSAGGASSRRGSTGAGGAGRRRAGTGASSAGRSRGGAGAEGAGSRRFGTGAGGAEPRRDCSWPVRHGEEQREKLETDSSSHDLSGAGGGKEKKTDGGWGNRRRAEKSDGVGESLGAVRSGAGWLGC